MAKAAPSQKRPSRRLELKVIAIGNSRGIRLPKALLAKHAISDTVIVEESERGLLLRSANDRRLSWEETFKDMARSRERWEDLDGLIGDGIDDREPW